ncbi:MAG: hypothetical protein NVSMB29_11680 [Candidatus Dormibacteria bacterium]
MDRPRRAGTRLAVCAGVAVIAAGCATASPPPTRPAASAAPTVAGGATSLGGTPSPGDTPSPGAPAVRETGQITYMTDRFTAPACGGGSTADLSYVVFSPSSAGPHPIVIGMQGTGFAGSAGCNRATGKPAYRSLDANMMQWAEAGFVAVNVGYHGYTNGLYGNLSYPGTQWGTAADGTVELNIKPAVAYFLSHDPQQYGADPSLGLIAFGGSSGAHNAYMLAITGVVGARFLGAVGWSGLPDEADAGAYPQSVYLKYMNSPAGSDTVNFGDPLHRLSASAPPQYIANGSGEFIAPANAVTYWQRCQQLGITACWLRIPDTPGHALAYTQYRFTGQPAERSDPAIAPGVSVMADSVAFAKALLP